MAHLYLRLIQEIDGDVDSSTAIQRLSDCISSAPGIEVLKKVEKHPRGGYSVIADRTEGDIELLITHLRAFGYRAVI